MLHERKKLAKIVEELTIYFFSIGADVIESKIQHMGKTAIIQIDANYKPEYAHKLESMHRLLNSERDDGVEDVYWELVGSGDPGESSQLLLVGMMCDKADVDIGPERVSITMFKKLS